MHDLTKFQRDILYVCAGVDDPYGLGIKEELDHYYETEITPSRLYMGLDELVEKGLIDVAVIDHRTKNYTLTADGREKLARRQEWKEQ